MNFQFQTKLIQFSKQYISQFPKYSKNYTKPINSNFKAFHILSPSKIAKIEKELLEKFKNPNLKIEKDPLPIIQKEKDPLQNLSTAKFKLKKDLKFKNSNLQTAKSISMSTTAPVEEIYQKLSQLEHILLRPDTYIGSTERTEQKLWIFKNGKFINKEVSYVEGLYKIFDEIIVNAADNKQRDASMNEIKVNIDKEKNVISVLNNGKGIPIEIHQKYNIYVPELIFGQLLTSSNYDDDKKKVTGGRNGYGAKLTNIFSKLFIVETCDSKAGKRYVQKFTDHMQNKEEPVITKAKGEDYTKITFSPDLSRFGMTELEDDIVSLMQKRVYDLAGILPGVKVFLNDERLKIKNFSDYVSLYDLIEEGMKPMYLKLNDRWEIAATVSDGTFKQVSFVNSICTTKGGQHVNYICDQICDHGLKIIEKEFKKNKTVKAHHLKNYICLFVNCLIENPAFDSQTKETLTTRPKSFGSDPELPKKFLDDLCNKGGLIEAVKAWAQFKQTAELKKKGGTKTQRLIGIPKLDDANCAGTKNSEQCSLILTEGDSAKTFAVSGLSIVRRDYYGIFPLRGKLLNVRDASHDQIIKNEEIENIVKILGLKYGQKYTDVKSLRYGSLIIMADQDFDGSHIKGLIVNFIHTFWPSLLSCKGFLKQFITPIVKITKGKQSTTFYTMQEYETWYEQNNEGKGWTIKYYKGLGTSTAAEAREYFSDLDTHLIPFVYNEERDSDLIKMAFEKKKVAERKEWINNFHEGDFVDYKTGSMGYDKFINKELIQFSIYDNCRSIPSLIDGFKPAQRKILYGAFKRNLKTEIKVAQLSGYVSEHAAYHHGDISLSGTIVGMAQNFVGSNNINLLYPGGQFGTRLLGGKDSASARYIFTRLEKITRFLFHQDDDAVLSYLTDDGQSVEPQWYVPIIPMILVNGSEGIGTGWSTFIPNYNPVDIIKNIRLKLAGQDMEEMDPWYKGFTGAIDFKGKATYNVHGRIDQVDDATVRITELPVRKWTQDYKQFLEIMMGGGDKTKTPKIKNFRENHTDTRVDFIVTLTPEQMAEANTEGLEKYFKMDSSISTSNMNVFDAEGHIKKYSNPLDVINDFYPIRIEYYQKRKDNLLKILEDEWKKLHNKVRFILAVVNEELKVHKRKALDICQELQNLHFDAIYPKIKAVILGSDDTEKLDEESNSPLSDNELVKGYDYLLSMKISSLTKERVEQLQKELSGKENDLELLKSMSVSGLWLRDLEQLEIGLNEMAEYEEGLERDIQKARKQHTKKTGGNDDDDDFISTRKPRAAPKPRAKPTTSSVLSSIVPILPIAGILSIDNNEEKPKTTSKAKTTTNSKAKTTSNSQPAPKRGRKAVEMEFDMSDEDSDPEISIELDDDDDDVDIDDDEIVISKKTTPKTKPVTKQTSLNDFLEDPDSNTLSSISNDFGDDDDHADLVTKPTSQSSRKIQSHSDEDESTVDELSEQEETKPKQVTRKPRAKKIVTKDISDVSLTDDDDDDDEMIKPKKAPKPKVEKEVKPRKPRAKKIVTKDLSDVSLTDDDDDDEMIKPKKAQKPKVEKVVKPRKPRAKKVSNDLLSDSDDEMALKKPIQKKENIPPVNTEINKKLKISKAPKPKTSVFDISNDSDSDIETLAQRIKGKKFEISPIKKRAKITKQDEDFELSD